VAAIDDLIAQIEDKALRERLSRETNRITKEKRFGLVFEDHLPELTPNYSAKVRRHSKVALRDGPLADLWRVLIVRDGEAHCRNIGSGETRQIPVDELVVVCQFGEPIFPALVPVDRVQNGPDDASWHTLIEADNYHALQLLEYLYAGKVDCIYIDPPYNSGARDWKYNNDYVDVNDTWRHSKWLAMMQRRLKLAKRLLNPRDSVLIVTIDEKEYLRLGLLLEQLFPEARIQMVSSVINPKGATRSSAFSRTDEYLFFVMIGKAAPLPVSLDIEWKVVRDRRAERLRWAELLRAGSHTRRSDSPNQFYPIFIRNSTSGPIFDSVGEPYFGEDRANLKPPSGCVAVWPIRSDGSEGNWQNSAANLRNLIKKGYARLGKWRGENTAITYLKRGEQKKVESGVFPIIGRKQDNSILVDESGYSPVFIPGTQWRIASHNAEQGGTNLQKLMMPNRKFPFPKSLYAVEDALRFFVANKPEALILDFFAGSGTTAHAVMRLNRQDGGRRCCICVTNNEVAADEQKALSEQGLRPGDPDWEYWGICQHITMPRLAAAITGETPDGEPIKGDYKFNDEFPMAEGLAANLEYFRLDFLDKDHVALGRQFREILPILWLRAGAVGPRPGLPKNKPIPAMLIPAHNPFAVLVEETRFADFAAELEGRSDLTYAYLVTDSEEAFQEMAGQLKVQNVIQLYRDYLENFVINKGEGVS
jgi:adenine-specific DNA-methyltransferase